ncbi:hypothetical protein [Listeria monocytogenes]|uniref:hypothetical protein n=1 Tax=Listeria monocytogenes TaxID=1639 RepID=UPI001983C351|nr:hypothetical protein [Listeria monocytogenes]HEL8179349.1 hypothetical protein [Listeria monocytogenes]HEM1204316.1 hypothetical protein [Listeria monocytogenes]
MNIDINTIAFLNEPSIGVLYLNSLKPTFVREKFNQKSLVYSKIEDMKETGFNYAYMNTILVIEDTAKKRPIYECMVEDLPLSTQGNFILFFHAEKKSYMASKQFDIS